MNAREQAEKNLNDIALLLMMVDEADATGLLALVDLVTVLKDATKSDASLATLTALAEDFVKKHANPQAGFTKAIETFLNQAQQALRGGQSTTSACELQDVGPNFDPEFLVEFIEKHSLLLDEFEGRITDFHFNRESLSEAAVSEFNAAVKSYLHNIKGDAGAIGLSGIESITHALEDSLVDTPAAELCDQLVLWREWVKECISAYANGSSLPRTTAQQFRDQLAAAIQSPDTSEAKSIPESQQPTTDDTYALSSDCELLAEFIAEAEDHLNAIEALLLDPPAVYNSEHIDTLFRGVHSLKGASSYFNLKEINETSHSLENLLDETRSGKRAFDAPLQDLTMAYTALQKQLLKAARGATDSGGKLTWTPDGKAFLVELDKYRRGELSSGFTIAAASTPDVDIELPDNEQTGSVTPSTTATSSAAANQSKEALGIKTFVKVDTSRLDSLIESIGEMVIYSSMLIRQCREHLGHNEDVVRTSHQVEKFSRNLQDIGMSMRLDPIKGLFQKMSRLVWDVSKKLKKEVNFVMHGEDTELDRTVIERLADPLMHMVRNALDHGLETPEEREKAGKSRKGTVELTASHEGGNILIRIRDDGRGLDPQRLIQKAREKGILAPDQSLTDTEAYYLIFAAGFSTAAAVTDISGRGVGMDVVRNNIEGMRGRVTIASKLGEGTTFTIELPLTLAIMDGIEAKVGTERFILPTLSVIELVQPSEESISTALGRREIFSFRGKELPLFRLAALYDIHAPSRNGLTGTVAIVENGGERIGIMIDGIESSCQCVIKNLGAAFSHVPGLSGCTIMPNGDIGLILDVRSLVQLARQDYSGFITTRQQDSVSTAEVVTH